ncbi:MAG: glycosyltransferase family 2 protein [Gammaproteobacteria bacterium]
MKFSVVTPSFNQGKYIQRTIASVLQQKEVEFEYVIMDGGSTDKTLDVLSAHANQLVYVSEPDLGQAHAVNKAIKQTCGEYIGWLNSDDIYYPGALKKVADFFDQHPGVDVVYGKAYQIDDEDQVLEDYPSEPFSFSRLKVHCFISQPAAFIRRSALNKHGMLNERLTFCMDYEYWLRLAKAQATFAYLPEVLSGARIYADTKSSRCYLQAHLEALNMLNDTLGSVPSQWIVNYSTAKVKTKYRLKFPQPLFLLRSWQTLWEAAGLHKKGIARLLVWFQAQQVLGGKIIDKLLSVKPNR